MISFFSFSKRRRSFKVEQASSLFPLPSALCPLPPLRFSASCLLSPVFCLLSPVFCFLFSLFYLLPLSSFAEATRPAWTWDGELSDTHSAEVAQAVSGPFQWSWQTGTAAGVSPETGLTRTPVVGDGAAFEGLVRENVALRREVERALRQLHESRQAQAALEVQVRDLEQKRASLAASLREVRTSDEVLAELARIRSERETLARDNERLKTRLESATAPVALPPAPTTPPMGSDLFKKIERDNLELKVELASLKQATREAEAAQAKLQNLKREQGEQAEQSLREKAELQARLEQLQEGKGESERTAERWSRQAQVAEKEARALRERVAEIEQELKAAKTPVAPPEQKAAMPVSREAALLQAAGGTSGVVRAAASGADDLTAKALRLAQRGKYRDAEKLYLQALARSPDSAAIHFNLGILYQEGLRSPAVALKHFKKYLELSPQARDVDQVRAWVNELEMGLW